MKPEKIVSYIGLAMKAGRVSSGEFAVEKAVKEGKAQMVMIAEDASGNTKKKFNDMCRYYGVQSVEFLKKDELGHIIGREMRACISVNDEGFARAIRKAMDSTIDQYN